MRIEGPNVDHLRRDLSLLLYFEGSHLLADLLARLVTLSP